VTRPVGGRESDVGICDIDAIAPPQDGQNRLSTETGVEHAGHRMRDGADIAAKEYRKPRDYSRSSLEAVSVTSAPGAVGSRLLELT
jgi:hypothetical protein